MRGDTPTSWRSACRPSLTGTGHRLRNSRGRRVIRRRRRLPAAAKVELRHAIEVSPLAPRDVGSVFPRRFSCAAKRRAALGTELLLPAIPDHGSCRAGGRRPFYDLMLLLIAHKTCATKPGAADLLERQVLAVDCINQRFLPTSPGIQMSGEGDHRLLSVTSGEDLLALRPAPLAPRNVSWPPHFTSAAGGCAHQARPCWLGR